MPFYALVFTLRSKVDLICTRAIRLVIAQSVQFSKIAKKLNIDLCQFSLKCSAHHMHFLRLLREDWGGFQ